MAIAYVHPDTRLAERVIAEIQEKLSDSIEWLDAIYGKVSEHGEGDKKIPKVYHSEGEYVNAMPDDRKGNYCFFDVGQWYRFLSYSKGTAALVEADFGIIFWVDLRTIHVDAGFRNIDGVKAEVLAVLTDMTVSSGSFKLTGIVDDAKGVFGRFAGRGYEEKYMMHPYGAFRVTGRMVFSEKNYG